MLPSLLGQPEQISRKTNTIRERNFDLASPDWVGASVRALIASAKGLAAGFCLLMPFVQAGAQGPSDIAARLTAEFAQQIAAVNAMFEAIAASISMISRRSC
jgi:hypothetical protein